MHRRYEYLLRNLKITHPNRVRAMDCTYIPVQDRYLYFGISIDLYSRFVVDWSLFNTMTHKGCREPLQRTIETSY